VSWQITEAGIRGRRGNQIAGPLHARPNLMDPSTMGFGPMTDSGGG